MSNSHPKIKLRTNLEYAASVTSKLILFAFSCETVIISIHFLKHLRQGGWMLLSFALLDFLVLLPIFIVHVITLICAYAQNYTSKSPVPERRKRLRTLTVSTVLSLPAFVSAAFLTIISHSSAHYDDEFHIAMFYVFIATVVFSFLALAITNYLYHRQLDTAYWQARKTPKDSSKTPQ